MENAGSLVSQGQTGSHGNNSGYGGNGFGNGGGQPIEDSTTTRPRPVAGSTRPPTKGEGQTCPTRRQHVAQEFRSITDRFTQTSNQIRTIEAAADANSREANNTRRNNGQGATSTIMDVLSRIPTTLVRALGSKSGNTNGLNAENEF